MSHRLLVVVYGHPEGYPPTLNALEQLAPLFGQVEVLFRPYMPSAWPYPDNVHLVPSGPAISAREQQGLPLYQRYRIALRFAADLASALRRVKPRVVLLYDPMALLAYALARVAVPNHEPLLWYHNHDVLDPDSIKPLSLAWFAKQAQERIFPEIDLFTLPALEREAYFPMNRFSGKRLFLPNLPSRRLLSEPPKIQRDPSSLTLLFQGQVAGGHGIEEILELLPLEVCGRRVRLVTVGRYAPDFRRRIERTVEERKLQEHVSLLDFTPYRELRRITAACDVGIAIYAGSNVMSRTVGTASNKIYEYAAAGLPVLYHDSEHFRKHLGPYAWAVPCEVRAEAIRHALELIARNYTVMSEAALADFRKQLHFEQHFAAVTCFLQRKLNEA